jgi:glycosyltransferase involved in cell wall biosynthesis
MDLVMKKLLIGIDGNEANVLNRVGSNQYAYHILRALHGLASDHVFRIYLKADPAGDMPAANDHWHYRVIKPQKLWTQARLPADLFMHRPRPNVFFSPGHYGPRKSPIPTVVSIMDLAFLHYPNLFLKHKRGTAQLEQWSTYSVKQSAKVIAISEHTRQDVIKNYQKDPGDVIVAYPGVDTQAFKAPVVSVKSKVAKKYQLSRPFALFVGTIQPRKNLVRLIEAFSSLPPSFKEFDLVIAGQRGWLTQEFDHALAFSKAKNRIKILGFVPESEIPALYALATCSVLIGLHEGFGMPAAESFACGTLPVVSNNSSLPEVVGRGGILVDPYSVTSIRHGLKRALELDETSRTKRIALGQAHIKKFDWQASAGIILETLEEIAYNQVSQ